MSEMLAQIRSFAEQLHWASQIETPAVGTHSEVLYAGMGGSGIAGDYLAAMAVPFGTRVTVNKGYGPVPPWAIRQRPLVIAASYSGNTEETLDFALAAHESGLPIATVTTGGRLGELSEQHGWPSVQVPTGKQPRAAAGYMIGAVTKVFEGAHAIDDQRLAFIEAAELAEEAVVEGSTRWQEAKAIASALEGRIPIVYGGGPLTTAVAQRWKTQINENAKIPSWFSVLPELDHNEIVSWETMPDTTKDLLGIVALTDTTDHDRIAARLAHTRRLTEYAVPWVAEVSSSGTYTLTRLVSLTIVGDLVSWMIAEEAGVDPVPVATIEKLKKLLVEE